MYIINEYNKGRSIRDIVKEIGENRYRVRKILNDNGIKVFSNIEKLKKYDIDENYFDKINNEHKAYTLGFLYADGYNEEKKNIVKITLKEDDVEILKMIREPICPDKPLRHYTYKTGKSKPQYSFVIDNSHISKKLSELGVVQAKTFKLDFPTFLEKSLTRHFIRGYFDGDGCITKQAKTSKYFISFLSTEKFINGLQNYLNEELDIKYHKLNTRFPERNNIIRTLCIGGNLQVEKILDHFYNNSTIYLERKYNKYIELKEINNSRYL